MCRPLVLPDSLAAAPDSVCHACTSRPRPITNGALDVKPGRGRSTFSNVAHSSGDGDPSIARRPLSVRPPAGGGDARPVGPGPPVGPPAAPLVEPGERPPLAPGPPVGIESHERPAGADQEAFHVGLERDQRGEVAKKVRARRGFFGGHDQEQPVGRLAPLQPQLLTAPFEFPRTLIHVGLYRPRGQGLQSTR
jgi:hypothetical protein